MRFEIGCMMARAAGAKSDIGCKVAWATGPEEAVRAISGAPIWASAAERTPSRTFVGESATESATDAIERFAENIRFPLPYDCGLVSVLQRALD